MTILAEIEKIKKAKTSIRKAIQQNGISMPNTTVFGDYDEYISRMSVSEAVVNTEGFKEYTEDYNSEYTIPNTIEQIRARAFKNFTTLKILEIQCSSVIPLMNTNAFQGTPIEEGTGFIYVPDDLVDSFKTAENWSFYAGQIVAVSTKPTTSVDTHLIENFDRIKTVSWITSITLDDFKDKR